MNLSADFLLDNPELVLPLAPWCRVLDNLELAMVLLTQPWVAGEGLKRADLERRLAGLAKELPLGQVYFQRVKRAARGLEACGVMRVSGSGRALRFQLSPRGFACLILNLRVLRADPTLDGSEMELKRSLVGMWNLLVQGLVELPAEVELDSSCEGFLEEAEALTLWGQVVLSEERVRRALDVRLLIALQKEKVEVLWEKASTALRAQAEDVRMARGLNLSALVGRAGAEALSAAGPEALRVVQSLASRTLPEVNLRARLLRYEAYLKYLDSLSAMYGRELGPANFDLFRQRLRRAEG